MGHVKSALNPVDEAWALSRQQGGLSSGEGLTWAVRDAIWKREPVRQKGRIVDHQDVEADAGISDKRLLVFEPELASTLRVMGRDGNTLSPTIRQAWDSGDLRIMTKNLPVKATGAHISIVGHITRDELRRYLDRTEAGGGDAIREKIQETNSQAATAISEACPSHDDYIWRSVVNSDTETRGPAGFAVYFVCDMSQEERLDELVEKTFGPIYNESIGEGKYTSWGWLQHIVGGKYRRLLIITAADFKSLLNTRASMIEKFQLMEKAATEFNTICKSHQDYMWEIVHEK